MNALLENNNITEIECGSNFAYVLNDNNLFLSTEYKVLQSRSGGCFVKCMKMTYNGEIQLYYLTEAYRPKYRLALLKQISCTMAPTAGMSAGYSPFSTQLPNSSQRMRRKYS